MNLSDLISQTIVQMLEQYGGTAEIQRNELASQIGCVPSQVSYVVTSRFTPEKGYLV
ncbi:MAG: CtsR family transcriptional regulator, partial [Acetanaerobacterium sp.]